MSKFFRSSHSSGSSSGDSASEDEDTEEILTSHLAKSSLSNRGEVDKFNTDALAFTKSSPGNGPSVHRDLLLHALLEERCTNEVVKEREANGIRRKPGHDREIRAEARNRYQRLCAQLAPLNLVSTGLEDDLHGTTRQRYRDGLDLLSQHDLPIPTGRSGIPGSLGRLLTDAAVSSSTLNERPNLDMAAEPESPTSVLNNVAPLHQLLMPSQYLRDFEELGVLGKGGYGIVFHVKHRLDGLTYAVKKVPIRPSVLARIQSRKGQTALDDMLTELRTLAKLDHPNVVRYFNSWIEWSTDSGITSSSDNADLQHTNGTASAVTGAEEEGSSESTSFRRVYTKSDDIQDLGISFESRSLQAANVSISNVHSHNMSSFNQLNSDAALWSTSQPTLALHMQMAMYPMTLGDFLSPKVASSVAPLVHCFHLEPSINILLSILNGVEYLHSESIVHRDLKPANIFLRLEKNPRSTRGCVDLFLCPSCRAENRAYPATLGICIGDFGLVTQIAQVDGTELWPKSAVGTDIYRPTSSESNVSPALDIFALGIIAFELLWKFDTQMERRETLQMLKQGRFPSEFPLCGQGQTTAIRECISTMLSKDAGHNATLPDIKHRLLSVLHAR